MENEHFEHKMMQCNFVHIYKLYLALVSLH